MSEVKVFWDPMGFELDTLGEKKYLRAGDGDTPYASMPIRMLSINTPEVHYPGRQKPSKHDQALSQLAEWLHLGRTPVKSDLAQYLHPKLATGEAGTLQERQGQSATTEFKRLLAERLTKPNGSKRKVFLQAADEPFDHYGRLLAYMAPYYSPKELTSMSRKERATFNLLMVESGWAAPFPIYPGIPSYLDLVMVHEAAKEACENERGAWADPMMLTGYEFRMCVRLYKVTKRLVAGETLSSRERYGWIERFCAE